MADTRIDIERLLGGVEDLLLDANEPATVTQNRLVGETTQSVTITKINMNTIPYEGKLGDSNFISLADKLNEIEADKDKYIAYTADGGIGIVSGDADLIWDGGALGSNEIGIVQKLSNGNYRWIGKTTIGSDNWQFRGRVSGLNGVNPDEYVTKSQLDEVASSQVQSDWNVTDTSDSAYIKNKPTIPEYSYATTGTAGIVEMATDEEALAGTDTTRYVTPAQLKAFSEANPSSVGISLDSCYIGTLFPFNVVNFTHPIDFALIGSGDIDTYYDVPDSVYTIEGLSYITFYISEEDAGTFEITTGVLVGLGLGSAIWDENNNVVFETNVSTYGTPVNVNLSAGFYKMYLHQISSSDDVFIRIKQVV